MYLPGRVDHRSDENGLKSSLMGFFNGSVKLSRAQKIGLGVVGALVLLGVPATIAGLTLNSPAEPINNTSSLPPEQSLTGSSTDSQSSVDKDVTVEGNTSSDSSSSSIDIKIQSSSNSSSGASSDSSSSNDVTNQPEPDSLTINGQGVNLPTSGSIHKRIKSSDGSTNLNLSVHANSVVSGSGL